ncbi:MAG: L,D-transpeptidase family protein [Rhizobiales bacterium]|nr:L,D-transpeptidase family protein [Hyphomicrobiales bacterium]
MQRRIFTTTAFDRRTFLRRAVGGAAVLAGGVVLPRLAGADNEKLLQSLIEQNQRGDFGQAFDSTLRNVRMPKASLPTLSPATVQSTEQAITHYESIVSLGGWSTVPDGTELRVGYHHASIQALRQRLKHGGDLDVNAGSGDVFDSYVEAAVRRFQARHGVRVDGVVRESTFHALNIPAEVRLNQLRTNLVRLRGFNAKRVQRFVVCNIPAAQIEAIDNGVAVSRHTAVVGKPDRASPEINSRIVEINFNPFWTVPVSLVRRDLIPRMQAEPDYLTRYHIRIYDPRGNELMPSQINWYSEEAVNYRFKQDPGDFNSLGSIRINFPSAHGVYMHDTPDKNLFGEGFRFHSSGCVRIQNVRELVTWLLTGVPGWSRHEIDQAIRSGERKDAKVAPAVPLHWVYITAWVTPDGVVQFRDDIYNKDGLGQYARTQAG